MAIVTLPYMYTPTFNIGRPLYDGNIFIGNADTDPRIPENQKDVMLIQESGVPVVAVQPIKIGAGGVAVLNGSPVAMDVTGDYSIAITDRNNEQAYYFANIGESQDFLQADLRSIALDLGLSYADIGSKLVTSAPETSLNDAEFILNRDTGEVWVLSSSIPDGSTVVSLSGSTLTTNNGQFELQSTSNDEYEIAPNRIFVSQMVIEGATGQSLPENGASTNYALNNQMALNWVVTEAVVSGTKDSNGNVQATSGKVRNTINKDEIGLVGIDELFGSVMQSDGTKLTQVYADGSGVSLGENATTVWLEIDFSQPTGFFYVAGISEQRGRLETKSVSEIVKDVRYRRYSDVTESRTLGMTYPNNTDLEREVSVQTSGGGVINGQGIECEITNDVDTFVIPGGDNAASSNSVTNGKFTIPPGFDYTVRPTSGTPTLQIWLELSS